MLSSSRRARKIKTQEQTLRGAKCADSHMLKQTAFFFLLLLFHQQFTSLTFSQCATRAQTHTYRCLPFVNHDECGGSGSQCSNLFRTHKGGVYSISMVIKPDWKACGHGRVRVCDSYAHTKRKLGMWSVFFFSRSAHWAGKGVVLIAHCTHTHKEACTIQRVFFCIKGDIDLWHSWTWSSLLPPILWTIKFTS